MEQYLLDIQDTVVKYAEILSKVIRVDVVVVDTRLLRVAGTGIFKSEINTDVSRTAFVFNHVLATGETTIIEEPGRHSLCAGCPDKLCCKETFEISTPILMGAQIIGIIGLVAVDQPQKKVLQGNLPVYLDFLEQVADFIGTKAMEQQEARRNLAMIRMLDQVINHMDQGVLIWGDSDRVTTMNSSAARQLGLPEARAGERVRMVSTGDTLNNSHEYKLMAGGRSITVMGRLYDGDSRDQRYSRILLFSDIKQVQSQMYELTHTVRSVSASSIIGNSPQILQLRQDILKIANSSSTVLITGESGTGKEMVATAIWQASNRKNKRFVAINCAAIPETLLESELFGYVKGAFTGADPNGRMGKFELANGGVIFLDEIGDMPIYLQAKLLRVLQERRITRIGSNQVIPIDMRIVAATNKDLRQMIEEKKFREDLYYRLSVIPLHIPPLRERTGDVEVLATHFIQQYAGLFGKYFRKLLPESVEALRRYPWPGNVRELENTVEFMVNMMEADGILGLGTLPQELLRCQPQTPPSPEIIPLRELEAAEIKKAMLLFGGSTQGKRRAAESLGIGLATLYRKLDQLVISQIDN